MVVSSWQLKKKNTTVQDLVQEISLAPHNEFMTEERIIFHCSWTAFSCLIVRESSAFPLALVSNSTQPGFIPCVTIYTVLHESWALQKDLHVMMCFHLDNTVILLRALGNEIRWEMRGWGWKELSSASKRVHKSCYRNIWVNYWLVWF